MQQNDLATHNRRCSARKRKINERYNALNSGLLKVTVELCHKFHNPEQGIICI